MACDNLLTDILAVTISESMHVISQICIYHHANFFYIWKLPRAISAHPARIWLQCLILDDARYIDWTYKENTGFGFNATVRHHSVVLRVPGVACSLIRALDAVRTVMLLILLQHANVASGPFHASQTGSTSISKGRRNHVP